MGMTTDTFMEHYERIPKYVEEFNSRSPINAVEIDESDEEPVDVPEAQGNAQVKEEK